MADDIYVSFGANTGNLEASLARAQSSVRALTNEMRNLANEARKTGAGVDSEIVNQLNAAGGSLAAAKAQVSALKSELTAAGAASEAASRSFHSGGVGVSFYTRELRALGDEFGSGRYRQALGTFNNLFIHFAQAQPAIAGVAGALLAAGGSALYFYEQMRAASGIANSLRDAMAFTGKGSALSKEDLDEITTRINKLRGIFSGLGSESAKEVAENFAKIPAITREMADAVIDDIQPLAEHFKGDFAKAAQALQESLESPKEAVKILTDAFGGLSDAQQQELEQASASLDPHQQQAAVLNVWAEALNHVRDNRIATIDTLIAQRKAQIALNDAEAAAGGTSAGAALEANESIREIIAGLEEERAKIEETNKAAVKLPEILKDTASSADALKDRFDDVLKSIAPWADEIKKASDNINVLKQGMAGVGGAGGKDAVGVAEGMVGKNEINDADDLTKFMAAGGVKINPSAFEAWCADFVNAALAQAGIKGSGSAAASSFANWGNAVDPGNVQRNDVIERNDGSHVGLATGQTRGSGATLQLEMVAGNENDRALTAQGLGPNGRQVGQVGHEWISASQANVRRSTESEALGEEEDKKRKLQEDHGAGSPTDQAELANQQARLAGARDEIAEEDRLVAARKQELAAAQGVPEQRKAQLALDQASLSLQEKKNAEKQAELELDVGKAKGTDDPTKVLAAETALINFKKSLYASDSAEYKKAVQEQVQADKQAADARKQLVTQSADDEIKAAQRTEEASLKATEEAYRSHRINASQRVAETAAAVDQELAVEKSALQTELALDNQRPAERKKILDQIVAAEQAAADKIKAVQQQTADQTAKQYEQAATTIESAFVGAFRGMIQGHESFRQAMLKGLEDVAMKAIETSARTLAVKIADLAAGKSAEQAVNTTAVAGDAGRAAAGAYAAVAGIPIIGPVLAPAAAAAAFAGTMAFGSMDIGAYKIPHDQMALVHKNELVMPAAQAGAFRSMLEGAAGGRPGGGDTHNHNTFQITEASNPRETARQVAKIWNQNPSIRPSY